MPRVLEVDDVQAAVVQHQIAAVIVAMAEHARLRGELLGDRLPFVGERRAFGRRQRRRRGSPRRSACEEVELPGQLLDVEGHPVRQVRVRRQLALRAAAAARSARPPRGRAPRARAVRRGAEMRLQRHIARDPASATMPICVRVPENRRHRQRHLLQQLARRSRTAAWRSRSVRRAGPARSTRRPARITRKYRRSDASPVSGTTRGVRRRRGRWSSR